MNTSESQQNGVLKRHEALAMLGWAFWLAWTNVQSSGRKDRWVWYGWWTVPVLTMAFMLTGAGVRGPLRYVMIVITVATVFGLLASRRLFDGPQEPQGN